MSRNDRDLMRRMTGTKQPARPALSVLFVDPDVEGAERLAGVLRRSNAVAVVASATAAFAAIAARMPSLIVTELDLPDASGLDLLASLRQNSATRNVLLMVVTRRSSVRDKIGAFQAGADDYLVKPLSPQQFEMHVQLLSRFRQVLPG